MPLVLLLALLQQPRIDPETPEPVPWVVIERHGEMGGGPDTSLWDHGEMWGGPDTTVWGQQLATFQDGTYVVSLAKPGRSETRICRSRDRGRTWSAVADLGMTIQTSLFVKGNVLYLLGVDASLRKCTGCVLIRRSTDQGETWTTETLRDNRYQGTLVPTIEHGGRFWRPFVRTDLGQCLNYATVASAPVDSDLLLAESWRWSEELELPAWDSTGWSQTCMLDDGAATPALLVRSGRSIDLVADPNPEGSRLKLRGTFPAWTSCPHALNSRLTRDPKSGCYFAVRGSVAVHASSQHKWIELASSTDLLTWELRTILLGAPPGPEPPHFDECDWLIEGEDLLVVQRIGRSPPNSPTNFRTDVIFYRVPKFRDRKPDDPPLWGPAPPK